MTTGGERVSEPYCWSLSVWLRITLGHSIWNLCFCNKIWKLNDTLDGNTFSPCPKWRSSLSMWFLWYTSILKAILRYNTKYHLITAYMLSFLKEKINIKAIYIYILIRWSTGLPACDFCQHSAFGTVFPHVIDFW